MYIHVYITKAKQGIHPGQLSLLSKKKLPRVGYEPTTLRVLGEHSTNLSYHVSVIWYDLSPYLTGDEIRRVVVETVIPLSKQFFVGRVERKLGKAGNVPDTILTEYDEFDDYLEMVVQFGVSTIVYVESPPKQR